jgi:hypothetical protein
VTVEDLILCPLLSTSHVLQDRLHADLYNIIYLRNVSSDIGTVFFIVVS